MTLYFQNETVHIATDGDGDTELATVSDASFGGIGTETGFDQPDEKTDVKESKLTLILGILCGVLFVVSIILGYFLIRLRRQQTTGGTGSEDDYMNSGKMMIVTDVSANQTGIAYAAPFSGPNQNESRIYNAETRIGKFHNIGRRSGQQDSLGMTEVNGGTLAIVADGMGGLSDGDRVSQKIVMTMLQDSAMLKPGKTENCLYEMIAHANREVNQMLGVENQYKSGSTVIAALVEPDGFQWATVGDSHIYLYRGNQLLLLNREHIYETELMQQAVNGRISFQSIKTDKSRGGLTSFIGMGELKYIDGSMEKLTYQPGDWLLLMSDGVFNTLPEIEICRIVQESTCAAEAAERMEQEVLARRNPKQDNFTAILIEL